MSQAELAKAAGLGQSDISKLELGGSKRTTAVVALAKALRVPAAWLEFGEGQEPRWSTTQGVDSPAPPPDGYADRREVSDSDWATLSAVKAFLPESELAEMRDRYKEFERKVRQEIADAAGVNRKVEK